MGAIFLQGMHFPAPRSTRRGKAAGFSAARASGPGVITNPASREKSAHNATVLAMLDFIGASSGNENGGQLGHRRHTACEADFSVDRECGCRHHAEPHDLLDVRDLLDGSF